MTIQGIPNDGRLYYLASPYSHTNSFIKQMRYEAVIYTASILSNAGYSLIEPIAMCHEQSVKHSLPSGYEFWKDRDRGFIDKCDGLIVLTLPGWDESDGVTDEIQYAESQGLPVHFLAPTAVWPEEVLESMPKGMRRLNNAIY